MGRWRNKWENEPKAPKAAPVDFSSFDQRLFDPTNALITNADKLELQELARAAAAGDPKAVQAYHQKLYASGLQQEEKDALANMFTYRNQPKPQPAPQPTPSPAGQQQFNERLFDPKNAVISHEQKLKMQQLAQGAQGGDPNSIQAFHQEVYNSGLTQEEKDALAGMFTYGQQPASRKKGKGRVVPTTANETKQAPPSAPPPEPKMSAKERMQQRYGVKPRMMGRGQYEY